MTVEWHGIGALHVSWELALDDAIASVVDSDIDARRVQPIDGHVADLLIVAYPATAHREPPIVNCIDDLRDRQALRPGTRLAAASCGHSDEAVTQDDVWHLLCSDGVQNRSRHAERVVKTADFAEEARLWLIATAHARQADGRPPVVTNTYSPDALIHQNEGRTEWLGWY